MTLDEELIRNAMNGNLDNVRNLLRRGANVNAKLAWGATPLIFASVFGHLKLVCALLNHDGVDVNILDYDGWTPLILACEKGHLEVVRALLNHEGVDVNIKTDDGDTALDWAWNHGNNDIACLLQEHMDLQRRREESLDAHWIETDPQFPNSPTQQARKRARTRGNSKSRCAVFLAPLATVVTHTERNHREEEEQRRPEEEELRRQELLNIKPAGRVAEHQKTLKPPSRRNEKAPSFDDSSVEVVD